jgi:archaellum component FlaG (FlaF/FlaG flagellin family)
MILLIVGFLWAARIAGVAMQTTLTTVGTTTTAIHTSDATTTTSSFISCPGDSNNRSQPCYTLQ